MSNLQSFPEYFSKSSTMPRCNNSAFPPFKIEYRYRGVYERAGFDYDKYNPKVHSPTNSLSPNSNGRSNSPSTSTNPNTLMGPSLSKKLSSISSSNATSRHTSNCTTTSTRQTLVSLSPHNSPTHSNNTTTNNNNNNMYATYSKDDDLLISTVRPRPLPEAETLSRVTLIQMSIPSDTHSLPHSTQSSQSTQQPISHLHSYPAPGQSSSYLNNYSDSVSDAASMTPRYTPFTSKNHNHKNLNLVLDKSNFNLTPVPAAVKASAAVASAATLAATSSAPKVAPLPYPVSSTLPDILSPPIGSNDDRFDEGVDRSISNNGDYLNESNIDNGGAAFLNLPHERENRLSQSLMVSSIISKEGESSMKFGNADDEDEDDSEINKELEMQLQQLKWTGSISSSSIHESFTGDLHSSSLKSPLSTANEETTQSTSFGFAGVDATPKLDQDEYESEIGETPRMMADFDDLSVEPLHVHRKSSKEFDNNSFYEATSNESYTRAHQASTETRQNESFGHGDEDEIAPLKVKKKSPSLNNIPRFEISDNSLSDIGETLPLGSKYGNGSESPAVPPRLRPVSPSTGSHLNNNSQMPNGPLLLGIDQTMHSHQELATKYPPGQGPCRHCHQNIDTQATSKNLKAIFTSNTDTKSTLSGQWHRQCFQCHDEKCSVRFSKSTPCYIFEDQPYCFEHYSIANGTVCEECQEGIEGEYIESERSIKFHPRCLRCMQCGCHITGGESYYVHNNVVYCDTDAALIALNLGDSKMEKRRTRIMFT